MSDGTPSNGKEYGERVHVSSHPIVKHKTSFLRSSTTKPSVFRSVLRELTYHLGYEATSTLTLKPIDISVPVPSKGGGIDHMEVQGQKIKEHVALIPILRSGLGMVDAMLELLPNAEIHHIGMYKAPGQSHPVLYFNRLPKKCTVDVAYVMDPCIATSSTIVSVVSILKKWGVKEIHVVAVVSSASGLKQLAAAHPDVYISTGNVDTTVSDDGLILPGIGDAGDRQFGTHVDMGVDDSEDLVHPSKRKRSNTLE